MMPFRSHEAKNPAHLVGAASADEYHAGRRNREIVPVFARVVAEWFEFVLCRSRLGVDNFNCIPVLHGYTFSIGQESLGKGPTGDDFLPIGNPRERVRQADRSRVRVIFLVVADSAPGHLFSRGGEANRVCSAIRVGRRCQRFLASLRVPNNNAGAVIGSSHPFTGAGQQLAVGRKRDGLNVAVAGQVVFERAGFKVPHFQSTWPRGFESQSVDAAKAIGNIVERLAACRQQIPVGRKRDRRHASQARGLAFQFSGVLASAAFP